jgi:ATP-dependent Clp protease, protease subunit
MTSIPSCSKSASLFWAHPINDQIANLIVAQLLYSGSRGCQQSQIRMYINSPGGQVYAGMAIYDTMQQVECPVSTVAVGFTASFGTILLTAGTKGMRYALPNAPSICTSRLVGHRGRLLILPFRLKKFCGCGLRLNKILSYHTGQPIEQIAKDTDRDIYMDALRKPKSMVW